MYAGLLGAHASFGFSKVPHGFVPTQDKQYLVAFAQLPDAATLDRTERGHPRRWPTSAASSRASSNAVQFPGLSINGFVNAPNAGIVFFTLKPFDERTSKDGVRPDASPGRSTASSAAIQDAFVAVFPPPPVNGLGQVGGFKLQLEDRAGLGEAALNDATQALIGQGVSDARSSPACSPSYRINVPQLDVDVDREKVKQRGHLAHRPVPDAAGLSRLGRTSTTSTASAAPTR